LDETAESPRMSDAGTWPIYPLWPDGAGLGFFDQRRLPELVPQRVADAAAVRAAIDCGAIAGPGCIDIAMSFAAEFAAGVSRDGALAAAEGLAQRRRTDRAIAQHVAALLPARGSILTHGAGGAFASGGEGTALNGIISASRSGKALDIVTTETAPASTGRRLNTVECAAAGVSCTVIPDAAAATLMRARPPAAIIVTARALAANGDFVAELGAYALALAAAHHRIALFAAVSRTSLDASARSADALCVGLDMNDGMWSPPAPTARIIAETRPSTWCWESVPGHLLAGIITEFGLSQPPYGETLANLRQRPNFAFIPNRA
jgi:methylthioribose-1-phosphate isomerase